MVLKEFVEMFDNWNGIMVVNDTNLNVIVRDFVTNIMDNENIKIHHSIGHEQLLNSEVESFGFYDNELCVRIIDDIDVMNNLNKIANAIAKKCGIGGCPCKIGCKVYNEDDCIDRIIEWLKCAINNE